MHAGAGPERRRGRCGQPALIDQMKGGSRSSLTVRPKTGLANSRQVAHVLKCENFVARYRSMDKLLFWLGIGAAQKGAGSEEIKPSRHPAISFVVGIVIALLIAPGAFVLLVSKK